MEREFRIRLNVCKSWGCPNLGVPDASDYTFPVYHLGYAALLCGVCNGLPPLFDEQECNEWFIRYFNQVLKETHVLCPSGCRHGLVHYGRTHAGTERFQCRSCRKVFSPVHLVPNRQRENIHRFLELLNEGKYTGNKVQHRLLHQAAAWCQRWPQPGDCAKKIATDIFYLPFQGKTSGQLLYLILSVDPDTGYVLQLSTNYSNWQVGKSLQYQYQYQGKPETPDTELTAADLISAREKVFMARSQFDEIQYGPAHLKRNDRGSIIRPVIAIHGHFQSLKRCIPSVTDHYLAHECVLRGAAITAWADNVRSGKTHLWFINESLNRTDSPETSYQFRGTKYIGWWSNRWQRWESGENLKMIGLLTGQKSVSDPGRITLAACHRFIDWLKKHPLYKIANNLSAGVISLQIQCLVFIYNQEIALMDNISSRGNCDC